MKVALAVLACALAWPVSAAAGSIHGAYSGLNCRGVWHLPDTGQTVSYTNTFGEDHDYQPASVKPSYTVLNLAGGSVTVDNVTGLMWMTNRNADVSLASATWQNAIAACENLSYAGYTDWRLPNIKELFSIFDFGKTTLPFINATVFQGDNTTVYWTSTTPYYPTSNAVTLGFTIGVNTSAQSKASTTLPFRCVRGGP